MNAFNFFFLGAGLALGFCGLAMIVWAVQARWRRFTEWYETWPDDPDDDTAAHIADDLESGAFAWREEE